MASTAALALLGPALNGVIKATDFAITRSQENALARVIAFDEAGKQKAVPFRLSLSMRNDAVTWALAAFLGDEGAEDVPPPVVKLRLGTKLRAEFPPGHYEIRAFFLAAKQGKDHRPRLLGYGSTYVLHAPGQMQTFQIEGKALDADVLAKAREIPNLDEIFTLPSLPPRLLASRVLRSPANSSAQQSVLPSLEEGDTPLARPVLPFRPINDHQRVRRAAPRLPPAAAIPEEVPLTVRRSGYCQARLRQGEQCGRDASRIGLCKDHLYRVRQGQKVLWHDSGERIPTDYSPEAG